MKVILFTTFVFMNLAQARQGFGPGEQDWGYVTVVEGAHMFWWLYLTTADVKSYTNRPLVIWCQGGPGMPASGFGNFDELGPMDLDHKERNHTWVKNVNVLFVDNPVGTGFSYVDDTIYLSTSNTEMALDIVELMKGFYRKRPEFIPVPLYIVSESYGGKIAIEMALVLDKAIKDGTIKSNFIGIGLGDPWVDPITTVSEWAPYLYAVGAIDTASYDSLAIAAQHVKDLYNVGHYKKSTLQWAKIVKFVAEYAGNIDVYNILQQIRTTNNATVNAKSNCSTILNWPNNFQVRDVNECKRVKIMRAVKKALALSVTWGSQKRKVLPRLREEFMKPVTHIVEDVLDTTNIKVAIFNGQLDMLVCISSTVTWVDNLQWSGRDEWDVADRSPIVINGIYEGFQKVVGKLALYWVNRAGHMVPSDNPVAMDYILRKLTHNYDGTIRRKEFRRNY